MICSGYSAVSVEICSVSLGSGTTLHCSSLNWTQTPSCNLNFNRKKNFKLIKCREFVCGFWLLATLVTYDGRTAAVKDGTDICSRSRWWRHKTPLWSYSDWCMIVVQKRKRKEEIKKNEKKNNHLTVEMQKYHTSRDNIRKPKYSAFYELIF